MSQILDTLKYTASHEWIRVEPDGLLTVGITDHAQALLGDIVFVEPPEVGAEVKMNEEAGIVESVKAASDIYAPVSGMVVSVNTALEDNPELINQDPYEKGWLFRVRPSNPGELNECMDAEAYAKQVNNEVN